MQSTSYDCLTWQADGQIRQARWRSEAALPVPQKLHLASDRLAAEEALRLAREGHSILWQGDYQKARVLLQAMARRLDREPRNGIRKALSASEVFHQHRLNQGRRAQLLARLLVPLTADYRIPLPRGQEVAQACREVFGQPTMDSVLSLRELLAIISAHEWRKKGIPVPAIEGRIYPHYGVFSPVRGEYVDLVANVPLPADCTLAFDVGVGSGILSAILARRGVPRVIATDQDTRALACAAENVQKLGLAAHIELQKVDLFPSGRAPLVICNPPWVPAQPSSPVEYAVYDPDSRMLRGFLSGLAGHLTDTGEGWLIISDLAEHLGLRSRQTLLGWIEAAGLQVLGRHDTKPKHPKVQDASDPLHAARAAEVTSLWRLGRA